MFYTNGFDTTRILSENVFLVIRFCNELIVCVVLFSADIPLLKEA